MFVARGHHLLPESWKRSRKVGKRAEKLEKLRSRPPPTLKVLQLQSQIEGPSRSVFMKIHGNARKFKKIQENLRQPKKKDLKRSLKSVGKMNVCRPGAPFSPRKVEKEQKSWKRTENLKKLRSRPPPTLKVLQLQSQIEGPSHTIFMKIHQNAKKSCQSLKSRKFHKT